MGVVVKWRRRPLPRWLLLTLLGLAVVVSAAGFVWAMRASYEATAACGEAQDLLSSPTTVADEVVVVEVELGSCGRHCNSSTRMWRPTVELASGEELRSEVWVHWSGRFQVGNVVEYVHDEGNSQWFLSDPRTVVSTYLATCDKSFFTPLLPILAGCLLLLAAFVGALKQRTRGRTHPLVVP